MRQILYYNALNHKWKIYEFKNIDSITIGENYSNPIDIPEKIKIIKNDTVGFPDLEKDAFKGRIDECGISGDSFEDPSFPPIMETILLKEDDLKMIAPMVFVKMSDHKLLKAKRKNSNHDLF